MPSKTKKPWYMAGSEGSGEYVVPARSKKGRVGFRLLSGGGVRVRVEPANKTAAKALADSFPVEDWKQPEDGGQFRFSQVIEEGGAAAIKVIERAIKALGEEGLEKQPGTRLWRNQLRQPEAIAA